MYKKFEINRTKIKGGCQSGIKVVTHNSKSDLLLATRHNQKTLKAKRCESFNFGFVDEHCIFCLLDAIWNCSIMLYFWWRRFCESFICCSATFSGKEFSVLEPFIVHRDELSGKIVINQLRIST